MSGPSRHFVSDHTLHPIVPGSEPHTIDALVSPCGAGAGKHVLCEKPIASNEQEAREMAAEAKKAGKVLVEAFHVRYICNTLCTE